MKVKWWIFLMLIFVFAFGCASKDPSGFITKTTAAYQQQDYPQALIYSAKHSYDYVKQMTLKLANTHTKAQMCEILSQAYAKISTEKSTYEAKGMVSELKTTNEARTRLMKLKYTYCR